VQYGETIFTFTITKNSNTDNGIAEILAIYLRLPAAVCLRLRFFIILEYSRKSGWFYWKNGI